MISSKNTHWTYSTRYHNHTKPRYLSSRRTLCSERTLPPEKRQWGGTLLSCQLMINGSASHLHHHRYNVPWLTTHTLFHCSKVAAAGLQGPFDIVWKFSQFALSSIQALIWPSWQICTSTYSLCLSARPSAPSTVISLLISKRPERICSMFMC